MRRWVVILFLLPELLYASVVTYTVKSKTDVTPSGAEPIGSYYEYSQSSTTGVAGQMTEGNSTTLQLYGFANLYIRSVTLMMRSNKNAGAGSLEMTIGDEVVWAIEPAYFSDAEWYGSYSQEYVPIKYNFYPSILVKDNECIYINIDGLINSLYIKSYSIEYYVPPTQACTVSFHTGQSGDVESLTESALGSGIILPTYESDVADWYFVGWMESPFEGEEYFTPEYMSAGEEYFPIRDCTLFALFSNYNHIPAAMVQDTTYVSGDFVIAYPYNQCMAFGGVDNGKVHTKELQVVDKTDEGLYLYPALVLLQASVFHIDFLEDSLAVIKNVADNCFIGFSETTSQRRLNKISSQWSYRVLPDRSVAFYHQYDNSRREFCAEEEYSTLTDEDSIYYVSSLIQSKKDANILFRVEDFSLPEQTRYTCFYVATSIGKGCTAVPVGRVEAIYTVSGEPVAGKVSELPPGVYILMEDIDKCSEGEAGRSAGQTRGKTTVRKIFKR